MHLLISNKVSTFLYIVLLFFITNAQSQTKVCLTGRIVENLKSYGQSFTNAVYLAKYQYYKSDKIIVKSYFYNNRPLEPIRIYRKMINEKCDAIIGFEYLSDLMLVIREQKNKEIPIFSSYASTANKNNFPKNVFIFMPSYKFQVKRMLSFLIKRYKQIDNVLLVTEINREEMRQYKKLYLYNLKKHQAKITIFDFLESDKILEFNIKNSIKNKKYDYVFLLAGTVSSAKIANIIDKHHTIFIGTENFGSSASPTFFIQLQDKKIQSYFIRSLDFIHASKVLHKFQKNYINRFGERPTLLSAYAYDAMQIIIKALTKKNRVNTDAVLSINYDGITGISLKNNQFHRSQNILVLSVSQNGYVYEE